jgi:hypothetical protein
MNRRRTIALAAFALAGAFAGAAPLAEAQPRDGCEVIVYIDANFSGGVWHTTHDQYQVPPQWNDQISSIRVISGVWEFYFDWHYGGERMRLGPGSYPYVGDHWNDQISSFRCVHPTGG